MEYWHLGLLAVRIGYKFADWGGQQGKEGLAGLTAGASLRFRWVQVDYAVNSLGDLGNGQEIELMVRI